MKNKITPTGREIVLDEDHFIVSRTDNSGRITYANRVFMQISGYAEKELLGMQHNLIRHPLMPRSAFKAMWDTISKGKEFFAYVVNMAKNGDHYWVFANVTPDYDAQGSICGYFSVRRKPDFGAVESVTALYKEMLEAETAAGPRNAIEAGLAVLTRHLQAAELDYDQFVLSLSASPQTTSVVD